MPAIDRKNQFDVVVVGGGPAGSTAAYHLAGSLDVLVVDKTSFPRHKACGGALTRCHDWPAEFPNYAEIKPHLRAHPNEHVCLYADRTPWWECSGTHFFDHVHRYDFDDLLLRAALDKPGVSFRVFDVKSLNRLDNGLIQLSDGANVLEARAVIGADGASSVVSRELGNPRRGENEAGACCEYHLVCDKPHEKTSVFYLWGGAPGYGWVFCAEDGYYVGVGYLGPARKRVRQYLDDLVAYCVEEGLLPREHRIQRTFGGLAPATVVDRIADNGVLLVGDAAGFLNQLNGEGIYYAMKSGQLAGRILAERLDHSALKYRDAVKPLLREVTYLKTMRPTLLRRVLSGYLGLTGISGTFGLDGYLKAPFVNRFFRRQDLPTESHYGKLRGKPVRRAS